MSIDGLGAAASWYGGSRGEEAEARARLLEQCPHPLALAQKFEPATINVPAMDMLSRTWVEVLTTPDGREVISMPAQMGKSFLARWSMFWLFLFDPSRRVMYGSYGLTLARDSGHEVRRLVEDYGTPYGVRLDRSRRDAGDWMLERVAGTPHAGRFLCISPDSKATGVPADTVVLDDVYSGEAEANSPATARNVERWWESTVRVRLRPKSPVVAIGTRFAEHDILSRFVSEGWRRINIPALQDGKVLDSVANVPGARTDDGWLITTRGTTPDDWRRLRAESTERVFASLMQGAPSAPEGNLFRADQWNRVEPYEVPPLPTIVIACDPAETGLGDEAGILVGGRSAEGHIYLLADLSGQLSQAQWARTLCTGLIRHGAHRILVERTLGMQSSVPDAWSIVLRQAKALRAAGDDPAEATRALAERGDHQAANALQVTEVVDIVTEVLELSSSGPRVVTVTPKQSKRVRAEAVAGLWELGRAHIVGQLPQLEWEALTFNPDVGKSPNRVDVMAHLLTHLDSAGMPAQMTSPAGSPRLPTRSGASSPTARPAGVSAPSLPRRAGAGRR